MNFELQQILRLIDQGMTHQQIAKQLQTTVGKVRYQLYKKRQQETKQDNPAIQSEQPAVPICTEMEDFEVHPWCGEDLLVLLPHSPEILYVYWEITDERKRLVEEHFGCGWDVLPKILRVYDVTDIHFNGDNAQRLIEIQVNDDANNWFIHSLNGNRNYCVDYGSFTWEGRFLAFYDLTLCTSLLQRDIHGANMKSGQKRSRKPKSRRGHGSLRAIRSKRYDPIGRGQL